jgi:hypothetical protein
MFEDFKEKVRAQNYVEKTNSSGLSPDVEAELQEEGLDPETATLEELFPEWLDSDGNDTSLFSGYDLEAWTLCWKTRAHLAGKYPLLSSFQNNAPEAVPQIDLDKAREDPKSACYFESLRKVKAIFDKIHILQKHATNFEKVCIRYYSHISYNWNHAPDVARFRATFTDADIFEAVDAYFKICKKYKALALEEPFYFLLEKKRLEVKLEGDMLKRTGACSENEIRVSILEAFE